jgi:hypothetical protein
MDNKTGVGTNDQGWPSTPITRLGAYRGAKENRYNGIITSRDILVWQNILC